MQATNINLIQFTRASRRNSNALESSGKLRRLSHDYTKIWKAGIKSKNVEDEISIASI
jgi:hypothetical protein